MEEGLDVCEVLDSNICSYVLEPEEVEHFNRFPVFHRNSQTKTVNYEKSFVELLHCEEAYE